MMRAVVFSVTLAQVSALIGFPIPTGYGTVECKRWPEFFLQNYNKNNDNAYLELISLQSLEPRSDATVVGLYAADSPTSQEWIVYQDDIKFYLEQKKKVTITNVAVNYYAPASCTETECTPSSSWWSSPFLGYHSEGCDDYLAGCSLDDSRLELENWQAKLTNLTTMAILQDTYWEDAWERLGGSEGDLFIYDSEGRLYTVMCSERSAQYLSMCGGVMYGGLANASVYEEVKEAVLAAARSDNSRCEDFDDDYYAGYFDDDYYEQNYANNMADTDDDFEFSEEDDDVTKSTEDDDKATPVASKGVDDDDDTEDKTDEAAADNEGSENENDDGEEQGDDEYYYYYNPLGGGGFSLGFHHEEKVRKPGMPSWAYASMLALTILFAAGAVVYFRWRQQRTSIAMASRAHSGATRFTRLATEEDGFELKDSGAEDQLGYGSL